MAVQFLGPIVATILYVIVFQKAGFKGAMLGFCVAPLVASAINQALMGMMLTGSMGPRYMLVPLVLIPLSMLPLLILAFKSWPPVTAPTIRSEK